jgi:hypothetical protein
MNVLQFIASLVGSLAWPAVVFGVALVLRKPLGDLLPLLQHIRYKDLELEFGKRVEELQAEVAEELPAPGEAAATAEPERAALLKLAEISPRAAVLEAWRAVEAAALKAARRLEPDEPGRTMSSYEAIRYLERSGKLDRAIAGPLQELRMLRNEAAHAPEFALRRESALEYASLAERLALHLSRLGSAAAP